MRVRIDIHPTPKGQRGYALIVLLAVLAGGMLYVLIGQLDARAMERQREEATTRALAQAKEALIAYAASVNLNGGGARPGDLPCPDLNNSGTKGTSCGNQVGTTGNRLGRLPWRDLGLPELRDGSGETLWYAVSNNFKENSRVNRLNSDTMRIQSSSGFTSTKGSITVRDSNGNIIFDGSGDTGVVAVIIAPGPPITRRDGLQQNRSGANVNIAAHYLDYIAPAADLAVTAVEDNADFDEIVVKTNGFFAGPVRTTNGQVVANDRIAVITIAEIANAMENRVAGEISRCLSDYAAMNSGRLPWPATVSNSASGDYAGTNGTLFGRVPDDFGDTVSAAASCATAPTGIMSNWTGNCMVNSGNTWFLDNWREQVFIGIATNSSPCPTACAGSCLSVDRPGGTLLNRSFVVLVAGRTLTGQARNTNADKSTVTNYLEGKNALANTRVFLTQDPSTTFNDRLRYFPPQ